MRRRTLLGMAVGALLALGMPQTVFALLDTVSIGNVTASTASVSISAGKLDGTLPAADWTDTPVLLLPAAWHGTVAVSLFTFKGPWVTTSGTHSLASTVSGTYTGSLSQASTW